MSLAEFRAISARVRNWGRWGPDDEFGTLNLITAETVRAAASAVRRGALFSLGIALGSSGPQANSPVRTNPIHLMTVDGGDATSLAGLTPPTGLGRTADYIALRGGQDLFRFNDDYIMMPLQAATQWDSLAHVYYEGQLYNGFPCSSVTSQGARHCGIDKVQPKGIVARGVLLDVFGHRAVNGRAEDSSAITPGELDEVKAVEQVEVRQGDAVVVRTGWWTKFSAAPDGQVAAAGLDWRCAEWLHDHAVATIAADHPTVEHLTGHIDGAYLPMHLLCLRDMGLMLGEYWDLEALAQDCQTDGVYEFQMCAPPLKVVGGVGSPVNPVAIK
jgi:kynurenine formamidase